MNKEEVIKMIDECFDDIIVNTFHFRGNEYWIQDRKEKILGYKQRILEYINKRK